MKETNYKRSAQIVNCKLVTSNVQRYLHNGIDDIIVDALECANRLIPANTRLRHNKLNILLLNTLSINLLGIIVLLHLLLLALDPSRRLTGLLCLGNELLCRRSLSLGIQVLNLGLAKDDVAVGIGRFVDIGLVNHKQNLPQLAPDTEGSYALGTPQGDAGDARDVLEAKLGKRLAGLLFAARVDADACACRDALAVVVVVVAVVAVVVAGVRVVRVRVGLLDRRLVGGGLVVDFFDLGHLRETGQRACGGIGGGQGGIDPSISRGNGGGLGVGIPWC